VGNAVRRNRAKRRLRALFIETLPRLKTGTYIFVAKAPVVDVESPDLREGWNRALQRARVLKKPSMDSKTPAS